ncbi:winged helix-turn-helix domain-containing protein [Thermodesulfobacteriota bacterium]
MAFGVKTKIWIENEEGKLIIGTGRVRILEAIHEVGSMNKAAKKLKQPFRAVWGKIRSTEERCGYKLVESTNAGTRLTDEGMELLWAYKKFKNRCQSYVDAEFREAFANSHLNRTAGSRPNPEQQPPNTSNKTA